MPKFEVDIVETIRYRLVVEAPSAEFLENEDPDTFADELSDNVGFVGVEQRVIESVNEAGDDDDTDAIIGPPRDFIRPMGVS